MSFMITQRKDKFKWPLKQDIIWVSFKDICKIEEQVATGKSVRAYNVDEPTLDLRNDIYLAMKTQKKFP